MIVKAPNSETPSDLGRRLAFSIATLCFLLGCVPHSEEGLRKSLAVSVAADLAAWRKQGSREADLQRMVFTNRTTVQQLLNTNVVVEGKSYRILLMHRSSGLHDKGVLLATADGDVLWQGVDGETRVLIAGRGGED